MKKRVRIPVRDVKELLDLANKVREKHLADGDASPLKVLNWEQINTTIDEAIDIEDKALKMKRDKLKLFQQRRRRLEAVVNVMRNTRDLLTAVHSEEMKALGEWGFDVLDNRASRQEDEEQTPENSEKRLSAKAASFIFVLFYSSNLVLCWGIHYFPIQKVVSWILT